MTTHLTPVAQGRVPHGPRWYVVWRGAAAGKGACVSAYPAEGGAQLLLRYATECGRTSEALISAATFRRALGDCLRVQDAADGAAQYVCERKEVA